MALYALLVGIDGYRAPVRRLHGCRNDVEAVAALLRSRLSPAEYAPLCLRDDEATRAALIDGFRGHLGQAGPGDSVLFWFSGHGSQAPVPPELAHLEPTALLQTLVCADSRHDGVPDLYDKELAVLIGEITARGTHVVAVLDCCHADSGTREADDQSPGPTGSRPLVIRREPALAAPPAVEALLHELRTGQGGGPRTATAGPLGAPHVLLAACHSDQYAVEVPAPDGKRGLFSLALLEQLDALGFEATCRELMTGARCRVEDGARGQVPVLSPVTDSIVDRPFLGGRVRAARSPVTMRWLRGVWEIDAGACHGVPAGAPGDPALFGVHGSDPLLEVRVVQVLADRGLVEPIGWTPAPEKQYPMVLTGVPLPVGTVTLDGGTDDGRTAGLLAAALDTAAPGGRPSPHVRVVDPAPDAERLPDARVTVSRPGTVRVTSADGSPLVPDTPCGTPDEAARVAADLEHIARWRRIKELHNPVSTLPNAVSVEVVAVRGGEAFDSGSGSALRPGHDGAIHLDYRRGPDGWHEPEVFVRLRNSTDRQLYCVLLDLTDRFRIHAALFSGDWIAPRHTASAAWGRAVTLALPPDRPLVPGATGMDWLKVLVAETPFNSGAFALARLGEPEEPPVRGGLHGLGGVLDRLGLAALHRDAEMKHPSSGDWTTTVLPVVVHVPGA